MKDFLCYYNTVYQKTYDIIILLEHTATKGETQISHIITNRYKAKLSKNK